MKVLDDKKATISANEQGTDSKLVPFSLAARLSALLRNHCPVNLKSHPLKVLLQKACRAFLVRVDLKLKLNMKNSIGIRPKMVSGIPHQINKSGGWYQNVLFSGSVPKPRYNPIDVKGTSCLIVKVNKCSKMCQIQILYSIARLWLDD